MGKRLAYIALTALGAVLATCVGVPIRNEVVEKRYVARSVTRHDKSVSYIAESSKDLPQRLMAYDMWPELRTLEDGDTLVYRKRIGRTPLLTWEKLEIEVIKKAQK